MMDGKQLTILGVFMFGLRWRPELARQLQVSKVAVHKWVQKDRVPAPRADEVRALFAQRLKLMQTVAQENHIVL